MLVVPMEVRIFYLNCFDEPKSSGRAPATRAVTIKLGADRARLQQRNCACMSHDVRLPGVVTPFQSQHVAVAGEDNGLPPPVPLRLLGDHQVADGDVVPGCRQPRCRLVGGRLLAVAWHRLTGKLQLLDDVAVQVSPHRHTVLEAEDGARALALVEKEALDLVLLDLMMPGISGYDVLALLKSDPRSREIPVIMISALSELDSIVRCIEAGADDYLAKPFDPILLRARVGSSLEKKHMRDREREIVEALRIEKERSEQLLLNILPKAIVTRLNRGETVIADQLSDVTILFADLIDFTTLSSRLSAKDLVRLLNGLFSEFDRLALDLGVEKIKTVGDAYMLAGGLPEPRTDHAHAVADMALAMIEAVKRANCDLPTPLQMRIGIHSGDVVAGVIGTHKFVYDIWGDAVNIASRMESHGIANRIQISAATHRHIHERFRLEPHGTVDIKGKGPMETFLLLGRC